MINDNDTFGNERAELDHIEWFNAQDDIYDQELGDLDSIVEEAGRTSDELPSDPDPGL